MAINLTDFGDHDIHYYLNKFQAVFNKTKYLDHCSRMMGDVVQSDYVPRNAVDRSNT